MFSPIDPAFIRNPYHHYPEIHRTSGVAFYEPWNAWFLFRHQDCKLALKDPRLGRTTTFDDQQLASHVLLLPILSRHAKLYQTVGRFMLLLDPPDHTRVRGTVQRAFSGKRVQGLRPIIADITNELVAGLAVKEEIDVIADFAFPLPVMVLEKMLGIPRQDRAQFRAWTRKFVSVLELAPSSHELDEAACALEGFTAYIQELLAEKKSLVVADPDDCEDLLVALLAAGKREILSTDEIVATTLLLMVAGHETTVHMLGNGVKALLENPEERELLGSREDLIGTMVAEVLRYDSPVQCTARRAKQSYELQLGGTSLAIEQGQDIIVMLGAANHDPEIFTEPGRFQISRQNAREHLAFGNGIHHCLGALLAEMEGQIAIPALFNRWKNTQLEILVDTLEYLPNFVFHGLKKLPVRLTGSHHSNAFSSP